MTRPVLIGSPILMRRRLGASRVAERLSVAYDDEGQGDTAGL